MQHVTLETDLRGRGDVPVSFPASASAHLDFPSRFEGNVLLTNEQSGGIVAELTKSAGAPLTLAVPIGNYEAIVRRRDSAWKCNVTVSGAISTSLDLDRCTQLSDDEARAKGVTVVQTGETWSFEAALGFAGHSEDAYTRRMADFGFRKPSHLFDFEDAESSWSFGVSRRLFRNLSLVGRVRQLESMSRNRFAFNAASGSDNTDEFKLHAYGLGVGARASIQTHNETWGGYAQLTLGPAYGRTSVTTAGSGERTSENHFGGYVDAAAGWYAMPFRWGGFYMEWSATYAPVVKNLLDDQRNSGGLTAFIGLRGRTWGQF
jgi:hypothetical protein